MMRKDGVFKSVIPNFTGHRNGRTRTIYPMPGGHGDAARWTDIVMGVGRIGTHLAQSFLMDHGTRFNVDHRLTYMQLAEEYARVRMYFTAYRSGYDGDGTFRKKAPSWRRGMAIRNDQRDHEFFVNDHHRDVVYWLSNRLGRYLDGHGNDLDPVIVERMRAMMPITFEALGDLGLLEQPELVL